MKLKVDLSDAEHLTSGFLKVDRYQVRHSTYAGSETPPLTREVLERGDSAGLLLHDPKLDILVLVEQFRLPAYLRSEDQGWFLETIAGVVRKGETPEDSIKRECMEETGYQVGVIEKICCMFPSVGGATERVHMFYAEIDAATSEKDHAGNADEGEDIKIIRLTRDEVRRELAAGGDVDAKLLTAFYWLELNKPPKQTGQ